MADSYTGRISKARSNDDMIFEGTRNIVLSAASNEMTMFISNSNVGIGTSNPIAPLHVVGNAYIDNRLHVLNHSTTGSLRVSKHTSGPFNPSAPSVFMNDAFIEIADHDGYAFSNASCNDIVFFQTNSNQNIQIGASVGARANITLTKSSTVVEATDSIVFRTNGSNALSIGQSGNVTLTKSLVIPSLAACNLYTGAGTQSLPSHTFSNDEGTGLFQPAPGSLAIAISATERIRFNSNGYVGIGTTTPESRLDVNGTVKALDFREGNVSLASKYAPSNETTSRLNGLDSQSTWTSNSLSNFANNANTNDAINRIDAMAFAACNAAVWGSNTSYWLSNAGLPQYALSNDIFPTVIYTSNTLSNVTMLTQFTPTSNAAFWASNELLTRPTGATVDLLYAKSNDTFLSIASNTVRSEWASNLSVWSSNSIVYTSNALFNEYLTNADVASTYATLVGLTYVSLESTFGCNAGTWASNSLSNTNPAADFGSNTGFFASNTAVFSSNSLSNYVLLIDAERDFARSNGQSNWNFGSNTAHWASNAADWASNTSLTTLIASNNYARSNQQSNWNYASNTASIALEKSIFSSNKFTEYSTTLEIGAAYAKSNAQSNWNFASNQSIANDSKLAWTSNELQNFQKTVVATTDFAQSNAQSNWVFASNTAVAASNTAVAASNTAFWSSNNGSNLLSLAAASNAYAASNAQSNWLFASNTAVAASNTAVAASNTALWASNNGSNLLSLVAASNAYAASNAQSNWVFASNTAVASSNTAVAASNTAFWSSNNGSNLLSLVAASNAYAASNAQSNWVFASNTAVEASSKAIAASNTAFWASNNTVWTSNALIGKLNIADANVLFAASNTLSNLNYASNTSFWGSNTIVWTSNNSSNLLSLANASNAYALSNAQSNWNYASNTAFGASNLGYWTSNNFDLYTNTLELYTTLCNYAPSNTVNIALTNINSHLNAASNTVYGCNGAIITWASNNFRNFITTVAANNTNAAIYGSNTSTWNSNDLNDTKLALSNKLNTLSNTAYTAAKNVASNGLAGIWSSNKLPEYILAVDANAIFLPSAQYLPQITWTSNTVHDTSNFAYALNTTIFSSFAASNRQSNWNFGSNTASWSSNHTSNLLSLIAASNAYAASNAQSNWVFASNTALWGSNNGSNLLALVAASNAYAASNAQSNWVFASNAAVIASNTAFWGSNNGSNHLSLVVASNAYAASNAQSNWVFASNTAFWGSNNGSNLLSLVVASNAYAASNAQSNWVFASNTSAWSSNRLITGPVGYWSLSESAITTLSNVGIGTATPNYTLDVIGSCQIDGVLHFGDGFKQAINLQGYVPFEAPPGIGVQGVATYFRTNGEYQFYKGGYHNNIQGNAGGGTALMTIKSTGNVGIDTQSPSYKLDVVGDINASTGLRQGGALLSSLLAASNAQSNWVFASNTAFWGSNNASNLLSLTMAINAYAASNAQSNWVFASNTSVAASNTAYWGSNNASNLLSLTSASNAYAASNAQSNWVFASNTAFWGSNNGSNMLSRIVASNAYAASNAQSNWVFASNTAFWGCNNGSNLLSLIAASNAYAVSNAQSNWVFASNTSVWSSNNGSNLLSRIVASNAYAASNAQSNWVFASNTAIWSSNRLITGPLGYWSLLESAITTSSNVGIGITTPSYRLHLNGGDLAVTNGGNTANAGGAINFGITTFPSFGAMAAIQGRLNGVSTTFSTLSGGLAFLTRESQTVGDTLLVEAMRISPAGQVGIGKTNPAYDLDVNGSCQISGSLFFGSTIRQMINLYGTQYAIGVQSSSTYFRTGGDYHFHLNGVHNDTGGSAGTGGTNLMTIKSTGNVGIGTQSPIDKLQVVNGDIGVYNGGNAGGQGGSLTFGTATHSNFGEMAFIKGILNNTNTTFSNLAGGLTFNTRLNNAISNTSVVERMRITDDGKIGIGTSSPATTLDVNGGAILRYDVSIVANAGAWSTTAGKQLYMRYSTFTGTDASYIQSIDRSTTVLYNLGIEASNIAFNSGQNSLTTTMPTMYLQNNGNVGIGTNAPAHKLEVNGTCQITGNLLFGSTARQMINLWSTAHAIGVQGNTTYFRTGATVGEYQFYQGGVHNDAQGNAGGGSALMTIKSTGNVGIGTQSPASKLTVAGEIASTAANAFRMVTGSYGVFMRFDGGNFHIMSTFINDQYGNWNAFRPFIYNVVSGLVTVGNNLNVQNAGNVGIGTTSPGTALDVVGTVRGTGLQCTTATGVNSALTITNTTGTANIAVAVGGGFSGDALAGDFVLRSVAHQVIIQSGTGGSAVCISTANNVGIGTSTPGEKLDVNGSFKASSVRTNSAHIQSHIAIAAQGTYVQWNRDNGGGLSYWINQSGIGGGGHIWGQSTSTNVFTERMRLTSGGLLGIGTSAVSYPLHVATFTNSGAYSYGYLNSTNTGVLSTTSAQVSIWADFRCVALEFNAKSDVRIKKEVTDVDDASALSIVRNIQPKQYKYIDTVAKGSSRVWGFIAQQIESVMEYAVSTSIDYIPSVFDHAESYDGGSTLRLENRESSCMYVGKLLKVYVDDANKYEETMVESILDSQAVLCNPPLKAIGRVFVYGQQVDDFKTLNKDAIFTVGIAAIQELDREVQQLVSRIEALEARL